MTELILNSIKQIIQRLEKSATRQQEINLFKMPMSLVNCRIMGYRQNTEITPRPIIQRPPYDKGGTLITNPAIAKPIPEQMVIISPNLR